jgi:hypothetical protein
VESDPPGRGPSKTGVAAATLPHGSAHVPSLTQWARAQPPSAPTEADIYAKHSQWKCFPVIATRLNLAPEGYSAMSDDGTDKVRQQRKIARTEWPAIAARRAAGESFASIGRRYHCSAPAIRYIVRQETAAVRLDGDKNEPDAPPRLERTTLRQAKAISAGGRSGAEPPAASRAKDKTAASSPRTAAEAGFDFSLREVMTVEVSAFLVAFDAVVAHGAPDAFDHLRGATDRLLRAAARTRIELERVRGKEHQ